MSKLSETIHEATAMVGERHADNWAIGISGLLDKMKINLTGNVAWSFDIANDNCGWAFGSHYWPRLLDSDGKPWDDDPLNRNDLGEVPLSEFIDYLHEWYYPRIKRSTSGPTKDEQIASLKADIHNLKFPDSRGPW